MIRQREKEVYNFFVDGFTENNGKKCVSVECKATKRR